MSKMKFTVLLLCLYVLPIVKTIDIQARSSSRDGRKLFGGYRITPKYCKPTRETSQELNGPNICMFNHECIQRNGIVVGACMDGFLFGACCQLPDGTAGELMNEENTQVPSVNNNLQYTKSPNYAGHITSSAVSQITDTLLNGGPAIPTAQEDAVVQINEQDKFAAAGVTHPTAPETVVINQGSNDISPEDFKPVMEDRKTTMTIEETTHPYTSGVSPLIQISISSSPPYYTATPGFQRPIFKPKPQKPSNADKYVLVPTINYQSKPNKTSEIESIVNIIQMLDGSDNSGTQSYTVTSTRRPPSTSYVFSATTTRRPGFDPNFEKQKTSLKPPSTYTTAPPRRTTSKSKRPSKPTKSGTKKPSSTTTSKRPVYQYVSSSTFRPAQTTYQTSHNTYKATSKRPSTSYVYSSTISRRPTLPTTTFSVTKTPSPPTLIVLGPITPDRYTTPTPTTYSTNSSPTKRPVTVTINNHITQNIYSTSERPSPTILITPKPSASSTPLRPTTDYYTSVIEVETSSDDLINFPPVRNPNLNMSIPVYDDSDLTTPDFLEDDALNKKVESFVNKIIEGLQEPFQGLRDVVYNKNKTAFLETTTKKPVKKTGTTKKPTRRPSGTTAKPTSRKPSTVKRPTLGGITTKKPGGTTSRRTKPTKKITTTISFIEADDVTTEYFSQDYRSQCGVRPLLKSGRIVGGKGANFGEFPWQVLVRESTWLGLFTKNKCGGVLISNQYVMTAAHCQPGFLASLVAVFGEFDISGDLETKRSVSRNVKRVIVHRQYDAATFENDLALLELEHPIQFDAHIVPICLPRDHEDFTGRMGTVTGWGRLKYGGGVPSVLQEVQVPVMENSVCQEMFRTAGHSKVILESFLCAGYANGLKDSCEGDSGGPLVLQRPDGRYQLAGTVSHGIKCAAPYLPGVYMRTTYYKPWIESITGVH